MKKSPNKRVQGTRHKVSGPLTRDVGYMKTKYKSALDVAAIILSIVAIMASIKSCLVSNEANRLSNAAFVFENRPLVSIDLLPSKSNTNRYYDVEVTNNSAVLVFIFSIENKGASPAENIHVLPDSRLEISTKDNPSPAAITALGEVSSHLSIAPGEVYSWICRRPIKPSSNTDPNWAFFDFLSENILLRTEFHLTYCSSELDNRKYSTRIRHEYSTDSKPLVLLNEYRDITADSNMQIDQSIVADGTNQIDDTLILMFKH
jgi:hypothetical protein